MAKPIYSVNEIIGAPERQRNRVTPEGTELGRHMARLIAPVIERLEREGEPDERCNSCAFRLGTVPNGCPQTQMDALKAVMEHTPFLCHQSPKVKGKYTKLCHGWYAARVESRERGLLPIVCPWEFSKDDEE